MNTIPMQHKAPMQVVATTRSSVRNAYRAHVTRCIRAAVKPLSYDKFFAAALGACIANLQDAISTKK